MTKPIGKSIRFLVFSVINSRRNRPALWLLVAIGAIIFLWTRNWKTDGDSIEHACTDAALFRWASSQGAELEKISIGEFLFEAEADSARNWQQRLGVRRGMLARKKILKGEVILSVPMNITFSAENALKTEIGDIVESLHLDQYVAMALMLLHERKKGAASTLLPIRLQDPRDVRDHPLLAARPARRRHRRQLQQPVPADAAHAQLPPQDLQQAHAAPLPPPPGPLRPRHPRRPRLRLGHDRRLLPQLGRRRPPPARRALGPPGQTACAAIGALCRALLSLAVSASH